MMNLGIPETDAAVEAIISAVEGAQRGMPSLAAHTFRTPTPPTLKLGDITMAGMDAALQEPVGGTLPAGVPASVELPDLAAPAFSTTDSTINLAFAAPTLDVVTYGAGISAPEPTYAAEESAPTYTPARYTGGISPPSTAVAFSVIPELKNVSMLSIAKYVLRTIDLSPIDNLVLEEIPEVRLGRDSTALDELNMSWAATYAAAFAEHADIEPYARYLNNKTLDILTDTKMIPKHAAFINKRRAVMSAYAAKGFSGPVGGATYEFLTLARDESFEIMAARNEARKELQQLVAAAMVAAADGGFKLERTAMDVWSKWAMAPVQLAAKHNDVAVRLLENAVGTYNESVSLISEHVQAYQAYAGAGREIIQAQITEATQDQYIAENYANIVEVFRAKTKDWMARVRQYALKVKGATLPIEAYLVYVASLMVDAQIARSNISMYMDAVSTFGESTKLYANNLELWAATHQADSSKLGVDLANIQAYRQVTGQEQDRVRTYLQYVDASTDAFTAKTAELNAGLQANSAYLTTLSDMVSVAKDYSELSNRAVTANARAQTGAMSAEAAYKVGSFSVLMNKYATDLAVTAADNQIEVANESYKKQGDQVRMAAVSSYLQGLYSSVVQSVSADVRYSGEKQFNGNETMSDSYRSAWNNRFTTTERYIIEPKA